MWDISKKKKGKRWKRSKEAAIKRRRASARDHECGNFPRVNGSLTAAEGSETAARCNFLGTKMASASRRLKTEEARWAACAVNFGWWMAAQNVGFVALRLYFFTVTLSSHSENTYDHLKKQGTTYGLIPILPGKVSFCFSFKRGTYLLLMPFDCVVKLDACAHF